MKRLILTVQEQDFPRLLAALPDGIAEGIVIEDVADPVAEVLAHVTAGRDHRGVEHTLCGLEVTWTLEQHNEAAQAGRWCTDCQELDA